MTIETNERREVAPIEKRKPRKIWPLFLLLLLLIIGAAAFYLFKTKDSDRNVLTVVKSAQEKIQTQKKEKLSQVIAFLPSWIPLSSVDITNKGLTQVIYFGLGVNSQGEVIKVSDEGRNVAEWNIFTTNEFAKFVDNAHSHGIKVVVALKNFDNESIDNLVSNAYYTKKLSSELVTIAKKYNIDGYNLDFEYVTDSNFPTKPYLNRFLKTIGESLKSANPDSLFSIDVNALATIADPAYDVPKIGELLDYMIIMGYDYTLPGATRAGPIAPLYDDSGHSVSKTVDSLSGRVPFGKVILGIPFYGYEWSTYSSLYRSATYEDSGALATYKRVKKILAEEKPKINYDLRSQEPWIVYRDGSTIKQVYYEDQNSIKAKVGFVRDHSMAGIAVWVLGYEGDSPELWSAIAN